MDDDGENTQMVHTHDLNYERDVVRTGAAAAPTALVSSGGGRDDTRGRPLFSGAGGSFFASSSSTSTGETSGFCGGGAAPSAGGPPPGPSAGGLVPRLKRPKQFPIRNGATQVCSISLSSGYVLAPRLSAHLPCRVLYISQHFCSVLAGCDTFQEPK